MFDTLVHRWLRVPYALHAAIKQSTQKPVATVLFIHGIGNSGESWHEVTRKLPNNIRVITIDLLGFGKSPQPAWAVYSAKTQARSVIATLLKLRLAGPVIIVGHSLGSLVAVEVAKRYPLLVRSLILCSPPFYKKAEAEATQRVALSSDKMLLDLFKLVQKRPEEFVRAAAAVARMGLISPTFNLTLDNAPIYMNALGASIINQTSLQDATRLKVSTDIICGLLDPVVILKNLKYVTNHNSHVQLATILAGHEVRGRLYVDMVVKKILNASGLK